MASIRRFEDLHAWQEARSLTSAVYAVTRKGPLARDRALGEQLQRASLSIMANIVEGFDSSSRMEFIRFLGYSRRSASEVQSHLYLARDQQHLNQNEFDDLYERAEKVRRMVTALMKCLRTPRDGDDIAPTRQRANAPTQPR